MYVYQAIIWRKRFFYTNKDKNVTRTRIIKPKTAFESQAFHSIRTTRLLLPARRRPSPTTPDLWAAELVRTDLPEPSSDSQPSCLARPSMLADNTGRLMDGRPQNSEKHQPQGKQIHTHILQLFSFILTHKLVALIRYEIRKNAVK